MVHQSSWTETHQERMELENEVESRLSDFTGTVTRGELDKLVQGFGKLGQNLSAYICNSPNCEKHDYEISVEAKTAAWLYQSQNYPLSATKHEELLGMGTDKVAVPLHFVSVPLETIEVIVGPRDPSEELRILGWYCSTECSQSADLSGGYFLVTCSVYVLHPPDLRREEVPPDIHRVLGPTPERSRHRISDLTGA